jgi:hypothetical protein
MIKKTTKKIMSAGCFPEVGEERVFCFSLVQCSFKDTALLAIQWQWVRPIVGRLKCVISSSTTCVQGARLIWLGNSSSRTEKEMSLSWLLKPNIRPCPEPRPVTVKGTFWGFRKQPVLPYLCSLKYETSCDVTTATSVGLKGKYSGTHKTKWLTQLLLHVWESELYTQ